MNEERYLALVDAAFEQPHDPDILAELDVAGDWLEGLGDPRGTVIALARAIEAARAPREAQAARRALGDYLLSEGQTLALGCEEALRNGWIRGLWRGGYLHELFLDGRNLGRTNGVGRGAAFRSALAAVLDAPICRRGLRRLELRVRSDTAALNQVARNHPAALKTVEMIRVHRGTDPGAIARWGWNFSVPNPPALHTLVQWGVCPLPVDDPALSERARLGRQLWQQEARLEALEHIVRRRELSLLPAMSLSLAPGLLEAEHQIAVISALRRLGSRRALPRLNAMARGALRYPIKVRSHAGTAVAQIRRHTG